MKERKKMASQGFGCFWILPVEVVQLQESNRFLNVGQTLRKKKKKWSQPLVPFILLHVQNLLLLIDSLNSLHWRPDPPKTWPTPSGSLHYDSNPGYNACWEVWRGVQTATKVSCWSVTYSDFFSLCSTLMSRNTVINNNMKKNQKNGRQRPNISGWHTHTHTRSVSEDCLCSTLKWCNTVFIICNLWFVQTAQTLIDKHMKKGNTLLHTCVVLLSVCLSVGSPASNCPWQYPSSSRTFKRGNTATASPLSSVVGWFVCIYLLLKTYLLNKRS